MSNNRKGPPPGQVTAEQTPSTNHQIQQQFKAQESTPEPEAIVFDSEAFSVVRINKVYKVIRIPFDKRTLQTGIPEVTYEDTSRWETQAHFGVQTDTSFLMNEEEDFDK